MQYIAPLAKLIEHFRALPGIGSKTAVRLAYHVLDMDVAKARALASAILEAREKIGFCSVCCNLSDQDPCAVCTSAKRDRTKICVVEQPQDVAAIERMKDYPGLYHVLHGSLSPLSGVGPENLRIKELLHRLEGETGAQITEIIMATNPTVEGEATAMYLARLLKPAGLTVTRIAHGLPIGGDLEYADEITLAKALENRKEI